MTGFGVSDAYAFLKEVKSLEKELPAELAPILHALKLDNYRLHRYLLRERGCVSKVIDLFDEFELSQKQIIKASRKEDIHRMALDYKASVTTLLDIEASMESLETLEEEVQRSESMHPHPPEFQNENYKDENQETPTEKRERLIDEINKLEEENATLRHEQLEMHYLVFELGNKRREYQMKMQEEHEHLMMEDTTFLEECAMEYSEAIHNYLLKERKKIEALENVLRQRHEKFFKKKESEAMQQGEYVSPHRSRMASTQYGYSRKKDNDE